MSEAGLHPTQAVASEKFGVVQSTISDWSNEGQGPTVKNAISIAKMLNVCVEWIYTERGPKRPDDAYNTTDPELKRLLSAYSRLNDQNRAAVIRHAAFTLEEQRQQARSAIKPVT
jgi:DNA-binding XRE family transcriptional regulator